MKQHIIWKDLKDCDTDIIIKLLEMYAISEGESTPIIDYEKLKTNIEILKVSLSLVEIEKSYTVIACIATSIIMVCEWLTMSKMIDIIGINLKVIHTSNGPNERCKIYLRGRYEKCEFVGDNLCDALWQAVKYVLEREG